MKNKMKKFTAITGSLLMGAFLLVPTLAFALAPFSLEGTRGNSTGDDTVSFSAAPPDYLDGSDWLFEFQGRGDNGVYKYMSIGTGISKAGSILSVTTNTIETPEGHLTDTLNGKASTSSVAVLATQLSSMLATMTEISANLIGTSTSMQASASTTLSEGLVTRAQALKLDSIATTSIGKAYEGTTARAGAFPVFKSASVSSGTAVFNLTTDGTSGGTALCTNGVIQDSVSIIFNDSASSFQQSWAFTNSNKTVTVTANKFTTANILSGLLGQAAANGSVVKLTVWCY